MPDSDLRAKYGAASFDAGLRIQPQTFERRVAQRDSLDQHFTKLWLDFAITGMSRRPALDTRTRLLVLIGQYTMAKSHAALEDTVRAALAARVTPREILEIILQCVVYGGHTTVEPAIQVFHRIAGELGLFDELQASQLPLDGNDRTRSYEEERRSWHPDDVADPRFARLMERHGWLAIGRGLTLRPRHHLNILAWLDAMDPEFAGLWVKFCYQGLYARGVVDERFMNVGELADNRDLRKPAMRLADIGVLYVEALLPLEAYGKVGTGMSVEVIPEAPVGGRYTAKVKVADRVLDAASGTFGVRLELPNPRLSLPAGIKCKANFAGLTLGKPAPAVRPRGASPEPVQTPRRQ